MITVDEDVISGSSVGLSANGPTAVRVFMARTTAGETMFDVLKDSNIPQYGALHPDTGGSGQFPAILALAIECEPEQGQNDLFKVTVAYRRPEIGQKPPSTNPSDSIIQVGSSVTSDRTQKDNNGDQIFVSLTGQETQVGDVEIQIPETILLFERREATSPLSKSIDYTGKVNSASLASGTYAERTLLCLGVEGVSTDDGETWQVSYRFQYRAETWDATVVYIDPETDRPHNDINLTTNDGVSIVEIYPTADFSTLSLPF